MVNAYLACPVDQEACAAWAQGALTDGQLILQPIRTQAIFVHTIQTWAGWRHLLDDKRVWSSMSGVCRSSVPGVANALVKAGARKVYNDGVGWRYFLDSQALKNLEARLFVAFWKDRPKRVREAGFDKGSVMPVKDSFRVSRLHSGLTWLLEPRQVVRYETMPRDIVRPGNPRGYYRLPYSIGPHWSQRRTQSQPGGEAGLDSDQAARPGLRLFRRYLDKFPFDVFLAKAGGLGTPDTGEVSDRQLSAR
jgi:hypothetical protein